MDEDDARARGAATAARRPHLEDVATHVGLSPATVSLVLSNAPGPSAQTRRRVLQAAGELGYRPDRTASLLARRRSHLLGVLLEVRNSFHAELVEDWQGLTWVPQIEWQGAGAGLPIDVRYELQHCSIGLD